jgi:hypothetical protein
VNGSSDTLPDDVQRALGLVVESNLAVARRALATVTLPSPAYAIGIALGDEDRAHFELSSLYIGLEADRQWALAGLSPYEAFRVVWTAPDFARFVDTRVERTPKLDAAVALLDDYIAAHPEVLPRDYYDPSEPYYEPAEWVLNHLTPILTRDPGIAPVTDDFVAFVMAEDFAEQMVANIRAAAPEPVAAALAAKGLLPDDVRQMDGF